MNLPDESASDDEAVRHYWHLLPLPRRPYRELVETQQRVQVYQAGVGVMPFCAIVPSASGV